MTQFSKFSFQPGVIIGKRGENLARGIFMDVSDWITQYGAGSFSIIHQRSADSYPYIITPTLTDGKLYWAFSNIDTAYAGRGKAEVRYTVGSTLAKSVTFETMVSDCLENPGTAPDPYEDWLDTLEELADTISGQVAVHNANASAHNTLFAAKQNATDNSLSTTSKTVVGAINELESTKGTYSKPAGGIPLSDLEKTVPSLEGKPETWVLNASPDVSTSASFANLSFVSDGTTFNRITIENGVIVYSYSGQGAYAVNAYSAGVWSDEDLKTVVFSKATSGGLLTWLTANAVKQTVSSGFPVGQDVILKNGNTPVYPLTKQANVDGLLTALAAKQDKLIAGQNITIAADGKTISATGGSTEPFIATYGVTTLSAIESAINAGSPVFVCYNNVYYYPLTGYIPHVYAFFGSDIGDPGSWGHVFASVDSSDDWNQYTHPLVTALGSDSTDLEFPSAKAVYNAVSPKYTKPAGGIPSSDLASGVIPDITGKQDKTDNTLATTSKTVVGAIGELKGDFVKYQNYTFNNYGQENLLRYATWIEGYYIQPSNGVPDVNASYSATGYIEIDNSKQYLCEVSGATWYYAFYDENKTYISGDAIAGNYYWNLANTVKYCRVSMQTAAIDHNSLHITNIQQKLNPNIKVEKTSILSDTTSITVSKDGTKQYTSIRQALESITDNSESHKYIVEFYGDGTHYDVASEFSASERQNLYGLTIPDYTSLIGIGGREKCILDCTITSAEANRTFSALNMKTTSAIKGFTVIGTYTRNVLHHDFGTVTNGTSIIEDCTFIGSNIDLHYTCSSGILSGCRYVYKNCIFENDTAPYTYSCHNGQYFIDSANIEFYNCRFKPTGDSGFSVRLGSIINNAGSINCNCILKGCKIPIQLLLDEESAEVYGRGILWKVIGYANDITATHIDNTDGLDYSANIDLIN